MSRAVMQQALEALEVMWRHFSSARLGEYTATDYATRNAAYAAIYQLRVVLAEPEQPVGINGLTEAETTASASVAGLVGKPEQEPQTTHWEGCEAVHPECRAKTELERKSDAIQRLWKERDELRSENRTLVRQNGEWQALNAELVAENEALKAELAEQARLVGIGSEREARLKALNAELVGYLRSCLVVMQEEADAYLAWNNDTNATLLAEIEKLKGYLNDKG